MHPAAAHNDLPAATDPRGSTHCYAREREFLRARAAAPARPALAKRRGHRNERSQRLKTSGPPKPSNPTAFISRESISVGRNERRAAVTAAATPRSDSHGSRVAPEPDKRSARQRQATARSART